MLSGLSHLIVEYFVTVTSMAATETLERRLNDFKTALEYLDSSGNLEILKAQFRKYQKVKVLYNLCDSLLKYI